MGSKFFSFRIDPISGGSKKFYQVASPEIVSIPLMKKKKKKSGYLLPENRF